MVMGAMHAVPRTKFIEHYECNIFISIIVLMGEYSVLSPRGRRRKRWMEYVISSERTNCKSMTTSLASRFLSFYLSFPLRVFVLGESSRKCSTSATPDEKRLDAFIGGERRKWRGTLVGMLFIPPLFFQYILSSVSLSLLFFPLSPEAADACRPHLNTCI